MDACRRGPVRVFTEKGGRVTVQRDCHAALRVCSQTGGDRSDRATQTEPGAREDARDEREKKQGEELSNERSFRNREVSPHARFVQSRRKEPAQPCDRLRLSSNQIAQPRSLARKDVEQRFGHRLRAWSHLLLPTNR